MTCDYLTKRPNFGMVREKFTYICELGGEIEKNHVSTCCETRYGYERCNLYNDHINRY